MKDEEQLSSGHIDEHKKSHGYVRKTSWWENIKHFNFHSFFATASYARTVTFFGILLIIITLPITVVVLQQRTQTQQHAYVPPDGGGGTCTIGYTGSKYCSGHNLVQKYYTTTSCASITKTIAINSPTCCTGVGTSCGVEDNCCGGSTTYCSRAGKCTKSCTPSYHNSTCSPGTKYWCTDVTYNAGNTCGATDYKGCSIVPGKCGVAPTCSSKGGACQKYQCPAGQKILSSSYSCSQGAEYVCCTAGAPQKINYYCSIPSNSSDTFGSTIKGDDGSVTNCDKGTVCSKTGKYSTTLGWADAKKNLCKPPSAFQPSCTSSTVKGTCYSNRSCGSDMHQVDATCSTGQICCVKGAPDPWYDCQPNNTLGGKIVRHTTTSTTVVGACAGNQTCTDPSTGLVIIKDSSTSLAEAKSKLCVTKKQVVCYSDHEMTQDRGLCWFWKDGADGQVTSNPDEACKNIGCSAAIETKHTCAQLMGPGSVSVDNTPADNCGPISGTWAANLCCTIPAEQAITVKYTCDSTGKAFKGDNGSNTTCNTYVPSTACKAGTTYSTAKGLGDAAQHLCTISAFVNTCTSGHSENKCVSSSLGCPEHYSEVQGKCDVNNRNMCCSPNTPDNTPKCGIAGVGICSKSSTCPSGTKSINYLNDCLAVSKTAGYKTCCEGTSSGGGGGGSGGGGGGSCTNGKSTKFAMNIKLPGIGTGSFENKTLKHATRVTSIYIKDSSGNLVWGATKNFKNTLGYDSNKKLRIGFMDLGTKSLVCGKTYYAYVKIPGYVTFRKAITYSNTTQTIEVSENDIIPGDIASAGTDNTTTSDGKLIGDDKVTIEDYNIVRTCHNVDPNTVIDFKNGSQTISLKCSDLMNYFEYADGGTQGDEWAFNYNLWLRGFIKSQGQ